MPLTNADQPTLLELLLAWRQTVSGVDTVAFLQDLHARHGKPIWISDIAFHSFAGDNARSNDVFDMTVSLVTDQEDRPTNMIPYLLSSARVRDHGSLE